MATSNLRGAPPRSMGRPNQPRRRRRRLGRRNGANVPGGYSTNPSAPLRTTGSNGGVRIRHEELFMSPKVTVAGQDAVNSRIFCPGASGMPILDAFGKTFDRYRIMSVTLRWRTSSGTTKSGAVILGVDGAVDQLGTTIAYAQALWPKWRGAVWAEGTVTPNMATLMPQKWLATATSKAEAAKLTHGAFAAVLALSGGSVGDQPGEVWCSYDVELLYPVGQAPGN